jgi:hypothetical protein
VKKNDKIGEKNGLTQWIHKRQLEGILGVFGLKKGGVEAAPEAGDGRVQHQ